MIRLLIPLTTFLSAFLLFQVQPMISKFLLPWYGGVPAIWTTCMLFFQSLLFIGYLYAHFVGTSSKQTRYRVHVSLLLLSLFFIPIFPDLAWRPDGLQNPALHLLVILLTSLSLPYLALTTTGPLLQAWYYQITPDAQPYRLYALSNLGSLLALLSYPFVVELLIPLSSQDTFWSLLYLTFALCYILIALRVGKHTSARDDALKRKNLNVSADPISPYRYLLWLSLSAVGVILMLAITNELCQDVASIPFLWIVPLSLYLLTFIIAFEKERWYRRKLFITFYSVLVLATLWAWQPEQHTAFAVIMPIYFSTLFLGCMLCHGELSRSKPAPSQLTRFYLTVSFGGAVGGIFIGIGAPFFFSDYIEFPLSLICCTILVLCCLIKDDPRFKKSLSRHVGAATALAAIVTAGLCFGVSQLNHEENLLAADRNFYGVLRVRQETSGKGRAYKSMSHGDTVHGQQYLDSPDSPTTYYTASSAIGRVLQSYKIGENRSIGAIGLGVGVIATYCSPKDRMQFYEINPAVEVYARKYFSFLSDTKGALSVQIGDGRQILDKQASQQFDILFLDAFSGGSIPVHLLTKEAFSTYLKHLSLDGLLVTHISNRYLNLIPVVRGAAKAHGLSMLVWNDSPEHGGFNSTAVVLARSPNSIANIFPENVESLENYQQLPSSKDNSQHSQQLAPMKDTSLWTDDHSNLLQVLR